MKAEEQARQEALAKAMALEEQRAKVRGGARDCHVTDM